LSLISLRFFGSDSGLSPLSWAAAADYVEILCSRVGCVAPNPAGRCDRAGGQFSGANSRVFTAGHAETAASRAALAEGVPVDI
jgi:hypothetical protein